VQFHPEYANEMILVLSSREIKGSLDDLDNCINEYRQNRFEPPALIMEEPSIEQHEI